MADEPTKVIDDLLSEHRTFPPPECFKKATLVAGTFLYEEAEEDYQDSGPVRRPPRWTAEEWHTICDWNLPYSMVHRRSAQRSRELPRPPRRGRPGRQGGVLLGG